MAQLKQAEQNLFLRLAMSILTFYKQNTVSSLSVGSFGPIDIKPESPTYGYITTTPKAGWANVDLLGKLKGELDIPMVFTTDVNSSAYGEMIVTGGKSLVY